MLFHIFNSQKERREFGGSDFIEMQYCKLEQGSEIEKIVSVDAIKHWKNDSLYIFGDDLNMFYSHYGKIITGGIYNNRDSGPIDIYGINFYSRKQLALIIERVKKEKPLDYQTLLNWLETGTQYIGFYILGIWQIGICQAYLLLHHTVGEMLCQRHS